MLTLRPTLLILLNRIKFPSQQSEYWTLNWRKMIYVIRVLQRGFFLSPLSPSFSLCLSFIRFIKRKFHVNIMCVYSRFQLYRHLTTICIIKPTHDVPPKMRLFRENNAQTHTNREKKRNSHINGRWETKQNTQTHTRSQHNLNLIRVYRTCIHFIVSFIASINVNISCHKNVENMKKMAIEVTFSLTLKFLLSAQNINVYHGSDMKTIWGKIGTKKKNMKRRQRHNRRRVASWMFGWSRFKKC